MYDIVYYSKEHEAEFTTMAVKLGYKGLVFLHTLRAFIEIKHAPLEIINAILCDEKDVQKARKQANLVLVRSAVSTADDGDRQTMEKQKPDVMFGFELAERRDYMHNRNSGLNQILVNIMNEKKIAYTFEWNSLVNPKTRVQVLGRSPQNIMLCRKYHVPIIIGSFAHHPWEMIFPKDVASMCTLLGLPAHEALEAFTVVKTIAEHNALKKSGKYIAEGVREV